VFKAKNISIAGGVHGIQGRKGDDGSYREMIGRRTEPCLPSRLLVPEAGEEEARLLELIP
jgi:hypothetical protein